MQKPIVKTQFELPGQKNVYKGKVRDVYNIDDEFLVMIVTDRISAFDVVLPKGIPYKGQVLNQIADRFLDAASEIVPTWKIDTPDPNVMIGHKAEAFPVEMVVRGYLTGHAWREYKAGKREICGEPLPEGMKEHQKFEKPILTPTTKAHEGHDEDISKQEIINQGLVSKEDYEKLERYSLELFRQGTELAAEKGLILVDTKYEFGKKDGKIYLIDEIHTPDSSRYFYADEYQERFDNDKPQKQLSKEFVREWLIDKGFQGKEGQDMPDMPDDFIRQVSERYIELFEKITGEGFQYTESTQVEKRIEENIKKSLSEIKK
jgi:phosphoribosylaminoimidazole-succinocarboxamide synthase